MNPSCRKHPGAIGIAPALASHLLALAEHDPRRAVPLARTWHASGPADPARLLALGWALMRWERTSEALPMLGTAEAILRQSGDHALARLCRIGLLLARQIAGEGATLQAAWQALAAEHTAAGEHAAAARARCEQAAHLTLLGDPDAAYALLQTIATDIDALGAPQDCARYRHVAGVAAADNSRMDEATTLFNDAAKRFTTLKLPIQLARVQFEQSWLLQRREQYAPAAALLHRARATFVRANLPLRIALAERDLGLLTARLGDFGGAIALTAGARAGFLALGRESLAAGCVMNLGAIAHYSGLNDLAFAAYEAAAAVYERVGLQLMALKNRRNQAMLSIEGGQPHDALALLDQIIPQMRALDDRQEEAEALAERARALTQIATPEQAAVAHEQARQHFLTLGNEASAAKCLLELAWLSLQQQANDQAADYLRAARAPLADRRVHLWRIAYAEGLLAERAAQHDQALAHFEAAGQLVAELRRSLAAEHASSALYAQASALHADAIRLAAQHGDAPRLLRFSEQQRALAFQHLIANAPERSISADAELEAQRAALRAALDAPTQSAAHEAALNTFIAILLRVRHPGGMLPPPTPFELARLRATISAAYGADWTLLVPIFNGQELVLLTLTADELLLDRVPLDAELTEPLHEACNGASHLHTYRDLAALRKGQPPTYAALRLLGTRLIPPAARARLHPNHRLLIVPQGPLHNLAWAALLIDGVWLVERAIIELLPGLSGLRVAATPAPAHTPALLVGCSEFGTRAAPLPRAMEALDHVAASWPGPSRRLAGAEATRAALLQYAGCASSPTHSLVHIATHAHFGGHGLLAHIKLADDDLLADDILRLRLTNSLVVLAACSAAAGEVLPGEEVLGLSRAFLAAGARAVIAGLWNVYDASVLPISEHLHTALAHGADPPHALTHAQRALLNLDAAAPNAAALRSPFAWAGFCVTSIGLAQLL